MHKNRLVEFSRNNMALIIQAVTHLSCQLFIHCEVHIAVCYLFIITKIFYCSLFYKISDIYLSTTLSDLNCLAASLILFTYINIKIMKSS